MFKDPFLKWGGIFAVVFVVGYLTEDIIMTNILGYYHCSQDPNPKTFIKKTVEYPESIYWEDNVYPGFNEEDRKLMIMNYLDGKHLKAMALNGDEGKVYIYKAINAEALSRNAELAEMNKAYLKKITSTENKTLKESLIKENRAVLAEKKDLLNNYVQKVVDNAVIYTSKETMPQMNYTVNFQPVNLGELSSKYLYSDKVTITDNHTQEVIAYNQRIMHFFYKLFPDISQGNIYFYPHPICGDERSWYERNVFVFKRIRSVPNHTLSINKKAYLEHYQGRR
ncbi:hypothetical protein JCM30760_16810 [Thiomicrorhabdus hydrogeniphila]